MFSDKVAYAVFGVGAVIMVLMPVFFIIGKIYQLHLEEVERKERCRENEDRESMG